MLLYAQRGYGRRASLYTDFTFTVWDEADGVRTLVPFTKAYSGLTDEEMRKVDAIVRKTTIEKFGPVRSVTPTLVLEIGFEGIQASPRHKSGIAVLFVGVYAFSGGGVVEEDQRFGGEIVGEAGLIVGGSRPCAYRARHDRILWFFEG